MVNGGVRLRHRTLEVLDDGLFFMAKHRKSLFQNINSPSSGRTHTAGALL